MKKITKIFIIVFLFASGSEVVSQPITWQRVYGNPEYDSYAYSVIQTFDGGFIISGNTILGTLVIKTNQFGDTIWSKTYEGKIYYSIIQCRDSNYILVGAFQNDTIFYSQGCIMKIDQKGNIFWKKLFGGVYNDALFDIKETPDKGLVILGTSEYQLPPPLIYSVYFIKTDFNGEIIYSKKYDSTGKGYRINEITGQGYLLSGDNELFVDYSGNKKYVKSGLGKYGLTNLDGNGFIFINTIDSNGVKTIKITETDTTFEIRWIKIIQKSNANLFGNSFIQSQRGYIIGGNSLDFNADINALLIKINIFGNIIWEGNLFSGSQYDESLFCISSCVDSGIIGVGYYSQFNEISKFYAVKTDKNGNTTPMKIFNISSSVPKDNNMSQNYPNPFNPSTTISFSLPISGNVKMVIYDITGKVIKVLVNEFRQAGIYEINFIANGLSSRIYFYKIQAGNFAQTKKMILIK